VSEPKIVQGLQTKYVDGVAHDSPWFFSKCETCGVEIDGQSERIVKFRMSSHTYWMHDKAGDEARRKMSEATKKIMAETQS